VRKRLQLVWLTLAISVKNSVWNAFPTWLETKRFLDLQVTIHVPRYDSNKKRNDEHVSKRSLRIYMYMKDLFIAEATIQKQHVNEKHLPGHYSHR